MTTSCEAHREEDREKRRDRGERGGEEERRGEREKEEDRGSAHVGGIRKSTPADDRRSDVLPMGA